MKKFNSGRHTFDPSRGKTRSGRRKPVRKLIRRLLLYFLLLLVVLVLIAIRASLPIISAYGARSLCTAVFLQGRDPSDVETAELSNFPFNLARYTIDWEDSSVTGKVWGMAEKKALYRKGLGSVLLNGISESDWRARYQPPSPPDAARIDPDTVGWPMGNRINDTLPAGVDAALMDSAIAGAFREEPGEKTRTRAVLVVYKGQLIGERYGKGWSARMPQLGWSMTKGITSALAGLLVKDGKLDTAAAAPVDQWRQDGRHSITLGNLLHMNSGLRWWEFYFGPGRCTDMLFNQRDMGEYAERSELRHRPGEVFNYSSGTANIISLLIRRAVGDVRYYRFPYERLFYKAGMWSAIIEMDGSGTFIGSSYCYATPRDWARFGLLYLQDGVWNGERILPEGWVRYTRSGTRYGAMWWLNGGDPAASARGGGKHYPTLPSDSYSCEGFEGQHLWVVPSKDLVILRMGLDNGRKWNPDRFLAEVLQAMR